MYVFFANFATLEAGMIDFFSSLSNECMPESLTGINLILTKPDNPLSPVSRRSPPLAVVVFGQLLQVPQALPPDSCYRTYIMRQLSHWVYQSPECIVQFSDSFKCSKRFFQTDVTQQLRYWAYSKIPSRSYIFWTALNEAKVISSVVPNKQF